MKNKIENAKEMKKLRRNQTGKTIQKNDLDNSRCSRVSSFNEKFQMNERI